MGNCCSSETGRTVSNKSKTFPGQGRTLGDPAAKPGVIEMHNVATLKQPAPVAHRTSTPAEPAGMNRQSKSPYSATTQGRTLSGPPATRDVTADRLTPQQAAANAAEERRRKNDEKFGKANPSRTFKRLEAASTPLPAANLEWRQD